MPFWGTGACGSWCNDLSPVFIHCCVRLLSCGLYLTISLFTTCLVGHPDPDQVLPRWLHQGAGELAVEVSHAFNTALPLAGCLYVVSASVSSRDSLWKTTGDTEREDGQNIGRRLRVKRGDRTVAPRGPEWASVRVDIISAWRRAGRQALAGERGQVWLPDRCQFTKLLLARNTSHSSRGWAVGEKTASLPLHNKCSMLNSYLPRIPFE